MAPILCAAAISMMKVPDATKKVKRELVSVIRKLSFSTVLFVAFFFFFGLTNRLEVNINSVPNFHTESLLNGFVAWSMIYCFYAGLLLFIFALEDVVRAVTDLSTRKPRKPRQAQQQLPLN
jgi:hypothetical protein